MKQYLLFSFLLISIAGFAQKTARTLPQKSTASLTDTTFVNNGTTQALRLDKIYSLFFPGTTLQYTRGDGSLATFPTNNTAFTNGAGYLTSSDITGKADKATTITINGTTFDLSANRSWTIAGGSATTDASLLTSGILPDARLSGNIGINLTPTAIKTASYTAGVNELVKTDATGGSIPVTLPTAPADKTRIAVKMIAVSGTNITTVATGGTDIFNKAGGSTSISLTLLNQGLVFQYESATGIWSVTSGDIPLSGLDARFVKQTGVTDIEITDATKGVILKSPNGTRYRIVVNNDGSLTTTAL